MFESFVIMLREGVEAALVIGITLVVLRRSGRRDLEKPVFWGVGLACLASVGAAAALHLLPINEEAYEGTLYAVSALFVATMMWWMHRSARTLRADIEHRVQQAVAAGPRGNRKEAWALGAFAFLMVFREGAEAVMFLSAVNLTTDAMLSFIGTLLGLGLAVTFAVMFVRGSLNVDLRRFFWVTECVLAIFVAQLVVNAYHEFSEAGLLPATQRSMALVGPVVRHNSLFILAIVAIPLFVWLSRRPQSSPSAVTLNGAERRLALARARREKFYSYGAIVTTVVVLAAVGVVYAREAVPRKAPPPEPVVAEAGWVAVPLSKLGDGQLHRLAFVSGNRLVRFLAMKAADGKVRTALDACEICGSLGYLQEGKNLVCLNCAAEINPLTMEAGGGCNPRPLPSEVTASTVRVAVSELEKAARVFPVAEQVELTSVDPVCGMVVRISEAAEIETREGKTYYFCNKRCHDLFRQNPSATMKMR